MVIENIPFHQKKANPRIRKTLELIDSIQEISNQIYAIKQSEFENLKLDSETWLKIQKAHLQEQYLLAEKRKGLMVLEAEVLGVARYN